MGRAKFHEQPKHHMKTYDQAPPETHERIAALIERFHPDLKKVGIRIDLLMASSDVEDAHAVTCGGYPAYAVVKILGPKERAMGRGDAEIVIDRDEYEAMTQAKRDALLDHELYHLNVKLGRDGKAKLDDHSRPCLKMRKHDRQFGWFDEIARRHQENSIEVQQATQIREEAGQLYLSFSADDVAAAEDIPAGANSATVAFVRNAQRSGAEVTISSGGKGVKITKDGIRALTEETPVPTAEQIEEAKSIARNDGHVTRSAIQRSLKVGYNAACSIIDRLISLGVVTAETAGGKFSLASLNAASAA